MTRGIQGTAIGLPNQGRKAGSNVIINNHLQSSGGRIHQQLGQTHPNSYNKRQGAHLAHTGDDWEPRSAPMTPMLEPFLPRHQTQLSYQLNPQLRAELSSGFSPQKNEGRVRKRFVAIDTVFIGRGATSTFTSQSRRGHSAALSPLIDR